MFHSITIRKLTVALGASVIIVASSTSLALFDKTRVVAHVGAGFFAFHHWVIYPYQHGKFAANAAGKVGSYVKGGLALLFAAHEFKVAGNIAHKSKDPLLHKLDAGLQNLTGNFGKVGQNLKAGQFDPTALESLNNDATQLGNTAASGGLPIKDTPVPVPGL